MKYRVVPRERDRYTTKYVIVYDKPTVVVTAVVTCSDQATADRIAEDFNTKDPFQ